MTAQIIPLRRLTPPAVAERAPVLPRPVPMVAWDPRRGVFIVSPNDPRWAAARAAYERLSLSPPPLVTWGPPAWRSTLRRLVAAAAVRRRWGRA